MTSEKDSPLIAHLDLLQAIDDAQRLDGQRRRLAAERRQLDVGEHAAK
jgi:hypothetical protein